MNLPSKLLKLLILKNYTISFAESATGGTLASLLVKCENASKVFKNSFVVYSDESKLKYLNALVKDNYCSDTLVIEMAKGLYEKTNASFCVATSGYVGSSFHEGFYNTVKCCIYHNSNYKVFTLKGFGKKGKAIDSICLNIYKIIIQMLGE